MSPPASTEELRKALYRACNPSAALPAGDPFYVDCAGERRTSHLIETLADRIRYGDGKSTQLLCGHPGSGKTTELFRLQHSLQDAQFVVYMDADKVLDMQDVGAPEVLLSIAAEVWDAFHERTPIALRTGGLGSLLQELSRVFSVSGEFDIEAPIPAMLGKLKATLKYDPKQRGQLREYLTYRPSSLLSSVNELLESAAEAVKAEQGLGLAVIFDSLDRVGSRRIPNSGQTYGEHLFIESWFMLSGLNCNIVYTLPPSIANSPQGGNLNPARIPMIPVRLRGSGGPDEAGLSKLHEILARRAAGTGLDSQAMASDDAMRRLCQVSGGFGRQLLRLFQDSLSAQRAIPVELPAVEHAIQQGRNSFADGLLFQPEAWPRLQKIADERPDRLDQSDLSLLDRQYILDYRDAEGHWYDVNPLVREARQFRQ